MGDFKIVVFLMAILLSLTAVTNKSKLPFPVILVLVGLIIGFVPQLPNLDMDPQVIFMIILPPLLYDAAARTSWHDFRTSIRPIAALAITLVFFTTVAVAVTAHYLIPGFSWPLAFVLGAVVSPPDAVAASGIIKGLGLNKKVITILEGESLVNDASALMAYRYAVAAVTTGTFVFWEAGLQFLLVAVVSIIIGIAIGYLLNFAHQKIVNNPVVETSLTLLAPFLSFLAAEEFHMSGVLAVVTTGLVMSWKAPEVFSYQTRMRTRVVWDTLVFILHGFVFILIGLQLPSIIKDLGNYPFWEILGYGLIISLVTILVRIIWVFAGSSWQNVFSKKKGEIQSSSETMEPDQTWKSVLVVAWTGTRGVISLAAALALPLVMEDGLAFPKRHSIIFYAFVVIFITLFVQGLSLPLLIKWLKIKPQDNFEAEEKEIQLQIANSTLQFIEQDLPVSLDQTMLEQLKHKYEARITELTKVISKLRKATTRKEKMRSILPGELLNAQLEINKFQRDILIRMHKEGEFSDEAIRNVERELDVAELQLNLHLPKDV